MGECLEHRLSSLFKTICQKRKMFPVEIFKPGQNPMSYLINLTLGSLCSKIQKIECKKKIIILQKDSDGLELRDVYLHFSLMGIVSV